MAIRTVEEAWGRFQACVGKLATSATERGKSLTESAMADDEELATFIRKNKGVLEDCVLTHASDLRQFEGSEALLDGIPAWYFCCGKPPCSCGDTRHGPLDATLTEWDPLKGLHLCRLMVWRHHHRAWSGELASFFADRLDRIPEPHEAPAELRDSIALKQSGVAGSNVASTLAPEVLPSDLDGLEPRDIEALLEAYVGVPIGDIEARLRPGKSSISGFLGPQDELGVVVSEDARRLRDLGVDRRLLAERLLAVINTASAKKNELTERALESGGTVHDSPVEVVVGSDPPVCVQAWVTPSLGFQENPFHTLGVDLTRSDFFVMNPTLGSDGLLQGSAMASPLIRRFCFFEGQVRYRIEPERAARILGLIR